MDYIEELKADYEYNKRHQFFADVDDEFLGRRCEGYYMKNVFRGDEGHVIFRVVFDNGHHYLVDGRKISKGKDIPTEYFIHKYLEKIILDFVRNAPFPVGKEVYCSQYEISVGSFVKLTIDRDMRIVCVSEIVIPMGYRHNNYGKDLLKLIYQQCNDLGYRLWLVNMVDSFYNKMVKRGAKNIEEYNIVEIDENTDLNIH